MGVRQIRWPKQLKAVTDRQTGCDLKHGTQLRLPQFAGGSMRRSEFGANTPHRHMGVRASIAALGVLGVLFLFVATPTLAADPLDRTVLDSDNTSGTGATDNSSTSDQSSQRRVGDLSEVIVTAQKREERLQDVPVPVTAITADNLIESGQVRLQDYYTQVPGLSLSTDYRGTPQIAIRGLTTGYNSGNPTVGITIDGIPYSSSSSTGSQGSSSPAPDIDPSDLARIEVLRGPQGTLYGASSLGGLINYVTVDPSTAGLSGRVETNIDGVHNGSGLGYSERGAVNIPINDTLAVRASAMYRRDPGFIDDIQTGQRSVNNVDVDGAHLSALWRPSDTLSFKVTALAQKQYGEGAPFAQINLGDLNQSTLPGTGGFSNNLQAYSSTLKAKIGEADLTAVSGYSIYSMHDSADDSEALGGFFDSLQLGNGGAVAVDNVNTRKFTQEVRLSIPFGKTFEWLIGGFYTHERSFYDGGLRGADVGNGSLVASFGEIVSPSTYTEYAAFTDLTIHFTDHFDVQLGGRESENRQKYSEIDSGLYGPEFDQLPNPVVTPETQTKDNAFTWLVTPRYKFTEDMMAYARLASGYRPGGPNFTCVPLHVPCHFDPDRTTNYEVGLKGDALDRRFSYDASVYYIDWRDIQLSVDFPPDYIFGGYENAGGAKSQGVELSADVRPWTGMTVSAWAVYSDAELTDGFPSGATSYGVAGERLPYSSRFSGNLSLQQNLSLTGDLTAFVSSSVGYVGDRYDVFTGPPPAVRNRFPAYAKTDLRTGAIYASWTFSLYGSNICDRRGILSTNPVLQDSYQYIQPRTIGLSVAKTF